LPQIPDQDSRLEEIFSAMLNLGTMIMADSEKSYKALRIKGKDVSGSVFRKLVPASVPEEIHKLSSFFQWICFIYFDFYSI